MKKELKTYGDLKKTIQFIKGMKKDGEISDALVNALIGNIPGIGVTKSVYDVLKVAFRKPDEKKSQTWLDKLDIDDDVEAIVDDSVENTFLKDLAATFENEPDDKELEDDFNMNQRLVDFLKDKHNNRTVTGIKENVNMKKRFQQLAGIIEQEQQGGEDKLSSAVNTINNDLKDQQMNFKLINTRDKMSQFLDTMIDNLRQANPDFVDSSQFSQAVIAFYNKYK